MSEPTLDQKRASHAYRVVRSILPLSDDEKKTFKTQVKRMPARIVTSGLGQALAFLEANKKDARELRTGLAEWINSGCGTVVGTAPPSECLLVRLIQGDSDFLRFATAECLAYLQWLVRFADAELADVREIDGSVSTTP